MQQLTVTECSRNDADWLVALLETYGALSVTMTDQCNDPILEPEPGTVPLWPHVVLQALYPGTYTLEPILADLAKQYPKALCLIESVPEQDWVRNTLAAFQPQRFGTNLWVCPSWHTPPDPSATHLILDPGLAFGTGSHATTSLCLTWLEQANVTAKTLLDYGCGSGILGIAALKLGASRVYAVDIDPQALTATQTNATINEIPAHQLAIVEPESLPAEIDVIIANILLGPLLQLKTKFYETLSQQGSLVLSGILINQTPELLEHYQSHFRLVTLEHEGDWALLSLEKWPVISTLN